MKRWRKLYTLLILVLCLSMTLPTSVMASSQNSSMTETQTSSESESTPDPQAESEAESQTQTESEAAEETEEEAPTESEALIVNDSIGSSYSSGNTAGTSATIPLSEIPQVSPTMVQNLISKLPSTYSLTDNEILAIQFTILIYVNQIREAYGVAPLGLCLPYCDAAMIRAKECQTVFEHTRPDGTFCYTVLDELGIPMLAFGENIASGQRDPFEAVSSWYNSPGHLSNMLEPGFSILGVGHDNTSTNTWVQLFGGGFSIESVYMTGIEEKYNIGTKLEEEGIMAVVTFSNGLESYIPLTSSMIVGYDPNKPGKQNITLWCYDYYLNITIELVDQVQDFVSRLYSEILNRKPDPSGLQSWSEVLKSGKEQGAKVAQGFIESDEFKKRNLSDTEYIKLLYRTFFDREADSSGLKAWLKVLDSGLSRMHVFKGFAESNEFTEICEDYGIIRGNVTLTAPMDQNEGVTKFIARCYRLCLGRKADPDGLNGWCNQILTGKNTAKEAAHGFVFSDEFKKKNLSDKAYVQTMYRVFMDREADPAGLNAWVNVLKNGQSREHVFNGFADSNEFKEICASYGIN